MYISPSIQRAISVVEQNIRHSKCLVHSFFYIIRTVVFAQNVGEYNCPYKRDTVLGQSKVRFVKQARICDFVKRGFKTYIYLKLHLFVMALIYDVYTVKSTCNGHSLKVNLKLKGLWWHSALLGGIRAEILTWEIGVIIVIWFSLGNYNQGDFFAQHQSYQKSSHTVQMSPHCIAASVSRENLVPAKYLSCRFSAGKRNEGLFQCE